jgi:hypothetical protein
MAKLRFLGVQVKTPALGRRASGRYCWLKSTRKKAMGNTHRLIGKLTLFGLQKV